MEACHAAFFLTYKFRWWPPLASSLYRNSSTVYSFHWVIDLAGVHKPEVTWVLVVEMFLHMSFLLDIDSDTWYCWFQVPNQHLKFFVVCFFVRFRGVAACTVLPGAPLSPGCTDGSMHGLEGCLKQVVRVKWHPNEYQDQGFQSRTVHFSEVISVILFNCHWPLCYAWSVYSDTTMKKKHSFAKDFSHTI